MTSWVSAAPFAPNEKSCTKEGLLDLASILNRKAAQIAGQLEPETADTLRRHMAVINSYYSNLIEGNRTLPHQIREAQRGILRTIRLLGTNRLSLLPTSTYKRG